jgi:predicted acetyltransferase
VSPAGPADPAEAERPPDAAQTARAGHASERCSGLERASRRRRPRALLSGVDGRVTEGLRLERPSVERLEPYLAFVEALRAAGDTVWPSRAPAEAESGEGFVRRVLARETKPQPPAVAESVYWATIEATVVGVIALRHRLTPALRAYGGHIGYEVHPAWRRRGVATTMLARVLETPPAQALFAAGERVLVTCAPDNLGSRRAIERCGGVLEGIVFVEAVGRQTCHYRIAAARLPRS